MSERKAGPGDRYVTITRQEFEQFLRSEVRKPFSLKSGTKGIYLIKLSDNVALAVNSTIGEEVRGLGKASIQLNFVSLHPQKFHQIIYGYKKIMARVVGKKHLQRSINWRKTLKEAIDKCIAYYNQGKGWFEKVALPDDLQQPSQPQVQQSQQDSTQLLVRIESIPNWDKDSYLKSFHNQLKRGRPLSDKQLAVIDQKEQRASKPTPSRTVAPQQTQQQGVYQTNLTLLRELWVTLKSKGGTKVDLDELATYGKTFANSGSLMRSDLEEIVEICDENGLAVPNFVNITKPNPRKLASQQRVSGQWNRVPVGGSAVEVYYRGIPTGSILKVSRGYEALIMDMGRPKSLGVFKTEDQAFQKIQLEK